jgi:hypothetical protein
MVEVVNPIDDRRVIGDCGGGGLDRTSEFLWFIRSSK